MSFAGKVKEELLGQMGKARHCQLAELAAFFAVCGQIYMNEEGECQVKFVTESEAELLYARAARCFKSGNVKEMVEAFAAAVSKRNELEKPEA